MPTSQTIDGHDYRDVMRYAVKFAAQFPEADGHQLVALAAAYLTYRTTGSDEAYFEAVAAAGSDSKEYIASVAASPQIVREAILAVTIAIADR